MIPRRRAYVYPGEFEDIRRGIRAGATDDGGDVDRWERAIADFTGMPHAVALSSGRRGMTLIFKHLGIGAGDEVIIPAYTLKDLVTLIQGLGAIPVPADIDPDSLNVTPESIERRITPRTKAILVLHIFGAPCAIEPIAALAGRLGIPLIEDCAHALGALIGERAAGSFGYAGFYSLEPTKPINTYGGGVVVTRDAGLAAFIRNSIVNAVPNPAGVEAKVRATRMERFLLGTGLGFPLLYLLATPALKERVSRMYRSAQHVPAADSRYSCVQARVGLAKLPGLRERLAERAERAELLRSLLDPAIRVQRVEPGTTPTWYFFVAILPCPAGPVRKRLLMRGIDAAIEEEIADDCASLLRDAGCPTVAKVFPRAIALPMYDGIEEARIRRVAKTLNHVLQ